METLDSTSTIANHWSMYNLKELYEVIKKYVESGNLDYSTLYPDYPSGGVIINKKDLAAIHATGKGKIILQAKARVEKNKIFITELPYQVYVEPLIEEIKKYALENENSGIDDVLNKSDKKGMLIEIDCESDPSGVLARLFKETSLQKTYNPNQFALVDDVPQLLNLKMYIDNYLKHNKECIMRETEYDLEKAASRLEIVEGLVKALEDIDNIISLIKSSESAAKAVEKLIEKYGFTQVQAKAIVDMKLGRLANLEKIELNKEKEELTSKIAAAKDILSSDTRWKEIYMERFSSFVKKYGTDRRTEVIQAEITKEEKEVVEIVPEDVVISITRNGLVKRTPKSAYKIQNKGGKGIKSANEALLKVIPTNTIDYLLLFSNRGKMYRLLVDNIPDAAKGTLLSSLVKIDSGESIIAATALSRGGDYKYITFFTKNGLIKRTLLSEYTEAKKTQGIQAIKIKDGDDIVNIVFSKEEDNYIIVSKCGFAIRVKGGDINTTGRTTIGMKGITLGKDDEVIFGSNTTKDDKYLGVLTDGGYGKKTELSEFVIQGRGGKGITTFKATSDAEHIAAAVLIKNGDSVLISGISSTLCVAEKDIPTLGRTTHGNIVMKGKVLSAIVL